MRYELADHEWSAIKPMLPTRYDRLAANYLAFVQLASIRLWLLPRGSVTKSRP
ncbi:hypothetical protein JQ615_06195 [Bradyrhizobium jicamae]|uniref:Transposase n=1 Tax=Bradyrhizobium jicamae TaxID=280332 RepID=A0ABS5FDV0_9BRAD|nr:hypothetical protein [Bradyrhizobium jicamae]MBR0794972.1 hypothetical protein [Bradyrhizobium jicamae]MBR0939049.1 hypothetical protein [Bradyrhizobium jicamae]